jgi:hypothetical protein
MRGEAGRCAPGHDEVDRKIDQLGRQGRKSLRTPVGKTVLEAMTSFPRRAPGPAARAAVPRAVARAHSRGLCRLRADFRHTLGEVFFNASMASAFCL